MKSSQVSGYDAECVALCYLQERGLKLVVRNYTTRYGEIDLVMRDRATAVFVEVRMRKRRDFGHAAETIDWYKRKRLVMTADSWIQKNDYKGDCRFDVVTIDGAGNSHWMQNAFGYNGEI